jgi:adenylylsulfate kinase-like enzyme
MDTKLIILRGPSGSGKSTIMAELKSQSQRKIATIEGDYFKRNILHNLSESKEVGAFMCKEVALLALQYGYDVIMEGIFKMKHYDQTMRELLDAHQGDNYLYYFNIPLEETIRRHESRHKKADFGRAEMTKWYSSASPTGYDIEQIIGEHLTQEQIVQKILSDAGI